MIKKISPSLYTSMSKKHCKKEIIHTPSYEEYKKVLKHEVEIHQDIIKEAEEQIDILMRMKIRQEKLLLDVKEKLKKHKKKREKEKEKKYEE